MSLATADIVGSIGAAFDVTITAGIIASAYLEVTNAPVISLAIGGTSQSATITSLPAGESWVRLDIIWGPGDPNALIGTANLKSGSAAAAAPPHRIDDGDTPGYVELWGK